MLASGQVSQSVYAWKEALPLQHIESTPCAQRFDVSVHVRAEYLRWVYVFSLLVVFVS